MSRAATTLSRRPKAAMTLAGSSSAKEGHATRLTSKNAQIRKILAALMPVIETDASMPILQLRLYERGLMQMPRRLGDVRVRSALAPIETKLSHYGDRRAGPKAEVVAIYAGGDL